ncbi:hypothetical protein [Mesorhizobium sp. M0898]|uniref:hypothetical protein n=1 Tax=Mesorhizobium sp. M0898 TaxID=2957020 RepID=UPI0033381B6B
MADSGSDSHFPLVFTSVSSLKKVGIALDLNVNKSIHFNARCYYYGDGGWDISVSPALLAFYQHKGFSRESLCLALISGIRFNPVTGKRLATYILINDVAALAAGAIESGTLSDELPLSIPECFKRGLPYSDCSWNYDPLSGQRLSKTKTAKYARIGVNLTAMLAKHPRTESCSGSNIDQRTDEYRGIGSESLLKGALCQTGYGGDEVSFYAYGGNLSTGFGYALYADGEAGPEASPAVVKAAAEGKKVKPQIDPADLRTVWNTGNQ